ncbi:MAG: hypothetical protein ACE5IG_03390, partial [Dehalococcoidia bacterium]
MKKRRENQELTEERIREIVREELRKAVLRRSLSKPDGLDWLTPDAESSRIHNLQESCSSAA